MLHQSSSMNKLASSPKAILLLVAFLTATICLPSKLFAQSGHVVWTQVIHMDAVQAESESGSWGLAILRVTADMKLTYKFIVHQIDDGDVLTNAHIHVGARGVNGSPFIGMMAGIENLNRNNTIQLTEAQYNHLVNDTDPIYINVHSQYYAGDSIRGQIRD